MDLEIAETYGFEAPNDVCPFPNPKLGDVALSCCRKEQLSDVNKYKTMDNENMLKYLRQSAFKTGSFQNSVEIKNEQALKVRFSKIGIFENEILALLILCPFVCV